MLMLQLRPEYVRLSLIPTAVLMRQKSRYTDVRPTNAEQTGKLGPVEELLLDLLEFIGQIAQSVLLSRRVLLGLLLLLL